MTSFPARCLPLPQRRLWLRHKGIVSAFSALLTIQGCAVAPPEQDPAERTSVALDRLAVLSTPNVPKGIASAASTSSAAEGATGGAVLGVLMLPTAPLLAIVALPLIPLGAIAGAAGGSTAARHEAEIAAGTLVPSTQQSDLQGELRDRIVNVLRQRKLAQPISPQSATQDMQPAAPPEPKVNATLQVGLREIGFTVAERKGKGPAYALFIKPQATLIGADGKSVLDEMSFELRSPAYLREVWLDREHSPFNTALSTVLDQAAERIVFEMLEVYYPKAPQEPVGHSTPTPYYTLAPVYPESTRGWLPGLKHPTPLTGDLRPHFRWQAFPRTIDLATVGGQGARFSDVVYDLRIFAVDRRTESFGNILRCYLSGGLGPGCESGPFYTLGPEVYRRDDLTAAEHRIEIPLTPCAYYAWTVRARFKLDGRPRAMEWTGDYLFAPWKVRRGLLTPGERNMQDRTIDWLLFRAPAAVESFACVD